MRGTPFRNRKIWLMITVWLLIILTLLLIPAPREWGEFGKWIRPHYDNVKDVLQPIAHIVLMTVLASLFMRCFAHKEKWVSIVFSFGISMALACTFECMQFALPKDFARRFDVSDIAFSGVGILAGCLIGLSINVRSRDQPNG